MKKCPFCAEEIQDNAIKCKHCMEFLSRQDSAAYGKCSDCGFPLNEGSSFCPSPSCGVFQTARKETNPNNYQEYSDKKNKMVAALLALVLGGFGIHKFYLQQTKSGFLYLIFFWTMIPALLGLIDSISLLTLSEREFHNQYN